MNRYFSHTESDLKIMFEKLQIDSIEELFLDIPKELRLQNDLRVPIKKSELELSKHLSDLSQKNYSNDRYSYFLGAGAYDCYIPAIIKHLVSRGEYLTSYTPYQSESSQGTLQTIFEFQTMMANLTMMDACNASMYDGATSAAEALLLACNNTRKNKVLLSAGLHPQVIEVCIMHLQSQNIEYEMINLVDGQTQLDDEVGEIAAVLVQNPNYYGVVENLEKLNQKTKRKNKKALFITHVDPSTLGIIKPPGSVGADIVVGEGQTLGIPLSYGGPYLGFMAVSEKLVRKIPGRVVGQTFNQEGQRRFVLTLQAREQHIRRYKAVSNICSNQGLIMSMATMYLALMGKTGLQEVGYQATSKAHYLYDQLLKTKAFDPAFKSPFFKEFTLLSKIDLNRLDEKLLEYNIINGYKLDSEQLDNAILIAVTEKRTKEEMDNFVKAVEEVLV